MSIFNTDPTVRINHVDRNAKLTWDLGPGEDFDGEPCTAAARLSVSHVRDRKQFIASVWRVDLGTSSGFPTEKFAPFTGTTVRLTTRPVARYSKAAFEQAINAALYELRTLVDEPAVIAVGDPASPA